MIIAYRVFDDLWFRVIILLDIIERGKKSIMGRIGGFGVGEKERGEYALTKGRRVMQLRCMESKFIEIDIISCKKGGR